MKIYYVLGILSLFILAACAPKQIETVGGGTPIQAETPASGEVAESNPFITVSEQAVSGNRINVDRLLLDKPGYVVVHKVINGIPGTVIGNSGILDGENSNVKVAISDYENENELIAMLHYDDGDSSYEFPGDDDPTTVDGRVIAQKFPLLTDEEAAAQSDEPITIEAQAEVKEIEVTAKQWEFIPNPIRVNLGDRVILKITSIDVSHGFALPEFGISERLNPGNTVTVEFTADKAGSFSFFCNVVCGSGHSGMRGTLIVS